jgi:hypothetical protein
MSFSRLTASRQLTHGKSTPPVQQQHGVKRKSSEDTQAAARHSPATSTATSTGSHRDKRIKFLPLQIVPISPLADFWAKWAANRAREERAKVTRTANRLAAEARRMAAEAKSADGESHEHAIR